MIIQGFFFFRTRLVNFFRHRPLQRRILDRPASIVRQQTGPCRQSVIPPPVAARPRQRCGPSCETAYPEDASAWSLIRTTASRPMLARPVRERIGTSRSFLRRQRHRLRPAKRFQQFSWH